MAWVVKRQKLNFKKVFFWNTLIYMSYMDTTIVYSVLSFEFWALGFGVWVGRKKRGSRGRFSNHCQMSLWKNSERKGV